MPTPYPLVPVKAVMLFHLHICFPSDCPCKLPVLISPGTTLLGMCSRTLELIHVYVLDEEERRGREKGKRLRPECSFLVVVVVFNMK